MRRVEGRATELDPLAVGVHSEARRPALDQADRRAEGHLPDGAIGLDTRACRAVRHGREGMLLTAASGHKQRHVGRVTAAPAPGAAQPHEGGVLDREVLEHRYRERASPAVPLPRLRVWLYARGRERGGLGA